jgi:hypothetical protein
VGPAGAFAPWPSRLLSSENPELRHPANLNFGDCFTYALALEKREPVLWKGDYFGHMDLRAA